MQRDSNHRPDYPDHGETGSVLGEAASRAVRSARTVGFRAHSAARSAAGSSARAVGGIGLEAGALVRDAVIGVVEGTGQVVSVTSPAIKEVVAGGLRGNRNVSGTDHSGSQVVAGAIVGAESAGLDTSEAVVAAVAGAVEGITEDGGDLEQTARVAVMGVVSGVAEAGGDVADAAQGATEILILHAVEADNSVAEIADVATSAVDAALIETDNNSEVGSDVVVAAAIGAVEAAYQMDTSHGDVVREAILDHVTEQASTAPSRHRRRLAEIAEQLSEELPRGRAAWRGKAIFNAVRIFYLAGGVDLAGSLAYFTILSLFPLIALSIMGIILLGDPLGAHQQITDFLHYYFPASGDVIQEVVNGLFSGSFTFGFVALLCLLIGANGLFRATNRAVNRVFGASFRSAVRATGAEMAVAALLVFVFLLSLYITTLFYMAVGIGDSFEIYFGEGRLLIDIVISAMSTALPVALTAFVFTFVYRHLPNAPVEWRDAAFGSLIAVVFFEIAKHGFFWFIGLATNRNAVYGPVSSVVVLLMWAYVSGLIFLYGVAVTRAASDLRPSAETDDIL